MTSPEGDRLTELLCSRLCHDLISPMSAITNGVELIADGADGGRDEAIDLIGASARQGAARLAYFRLALGAGGGNSAVPIGQIRKTVSDYFDDRKLAVAWDGTNVSDSDHVDRPMGKLLLNLILLAGECALRDAGISVELNADSRAMKIAIRGRRVRLRDDVRTGLDPDLPPDGLTVRNVIAHNCRRLCDAAGLQFTIVEDGESSVILAVG